MDGGLYGAAVIGHHSSTEVGPRFADELLEGITHFYDDSLSIDDGRGLWETEECGLIR
jgi:hypothetical protein